MLRVLAFLIFCAGSPAIAGPPDAAPADAPDILVTDFDAAGLAPDERRLVQLALVSTGDYADRLDGVWGANSQRALDAWARREFDDLPLGLYAAVLMVSFLDRIETEGWAHVEIPGRGAGITLPLARLRAMESVGDGRRWFDTSGGRLSVEMIAQDTREAVATHAARDAAIAEAAWTIRSGDLMVTAGRLADGGVFHLRSEREGDVWSTFHLVGDAEDFGTLNLAVASLEQTAPLRWTLPEGGALEMLIAESVALLGAPDVGMPVPPEPVSRPPDGGDLLGSGTGFYLGARLLVTARHVIDGCGRVTLADGTDLTLAAVDADLDVAVLTTARPSTTWLRMTDGPGSRLGQSVHAVGFPYYSLTGTAMHLTSGNVSALAGMDDDPRFVSFTAPVQPGNSGGPLIDRGGAVAGVVIARLSDTYIVETTGTVPQNINFALSSAELRGFLDRNGLDAASDGLPEWDMADGAPAGIAEAVVPIVCH